MTGCIPRYLYAVEATGYSIAKIGTTYHPADRIKNIGSTAPFDLTFRRLLLLPTVEVAAHWESRILALANRYRPNGEWVTADDHLNRLLDEVSPADDVTDCWDGVSLGKPIYEWHREREDALRRARLRAQVGAGPEYLPETQGLTEHNMRQRIVLARLRDGYGFDDIQALDGIPREEARRLSGRAPLYADAAA